MSGGRQLNDTECATYFDSLDTTFFEPATTSVFEPGDTVPVRWYAGIVHTNGTGGPSAAPGTTFNLVLSAYRNDSFVYHVLQNTTVPFSGIANDDPVYWSYIPGAPCAATEISYFWPVPGGFEPASDKDFDYVLLVETIIQTGWALSQSEPFRILAAKPTTTTTSSSSSSASPTGTIDPSSIPGSDSNSTPHPSSPSRKSSRKLSGGAIAGISIAGFIVLVVLRLAIRGYLKSKPLKKPPTSSEEAPPDRAHGDGGAVAGARNNEKVEIDGKQLPNESGGAALHELADGPHSGTQRDTVISELSGETRH